jgi:hypothetical protein
MIGGLGSVEFGLFNWLNIFYYGEESTECLKLAGGTRI